MIPLALAMGAGVLLAWRVDLAVGAWLALAGAGVLTAAVSLARPGREALALACVLVASLSVGGARMEQVFNTAEPADVQTCVAAGRALATLEGRIATVPQIVHPPIEFGYRPEPRMSFLLDVESFATPAGPLPATGLVRVSIDEPYRPLSPGQRVRLMGWVGRFGPPSNPGVYDAQAMARLTGATVWLAVPTEQAVDVRDESSPASSWVWHLRTLLRQRLTETGSLRSGRLVSALILGERHPSLASLNDTMRRAGLAHFLSISGLHLGIFLGFVYLLCRLAMLSPRSAAVVVLVVLAWFLLMAQPRAPLLRSGIMAACLAGGILLGRTGSSLNALAVAWVVLLAIDPRQLLLPGFQLSFLIVAGLILLTPRVRVILFGTWLRHRGLMVLRDPGWLRRWWVRRIRETLMSLVAMTVTAYLISAPLAAMHFGLFSPLAIVLSILVLPMVAAVLIPGYTALALTALMPNLAAAIGSLASAAAGVLAGFIDLLGALPLSLPVRPVGPAWVALYYAALLAVLLAGRSGRRWALAGLLVVSLAGVTAWTQRPRTTPPETAELHLLDVSDGQCAILQTPSGASYLIDAGTRSGYDAWDRALDPFLREMRLPDPEAAFVSHANTDHYSAVPGLVRHRDLARAWMCDYFQPTANPYDAETRLLNILGRHGVQLGRLRRGDTMQLDEHARLEVLWPPPGRDDLTSNDTSLVVKITCGGKRILLPGDLGETGQAELLTDPAQLRADVLVVPHHGGWEKTLPAFVQAVAPEVVLVSGSKDPQGPSTAGREIREFYNSLRQHYRYRSTARDGWLRVRLGPGPIDLTSMREQRRR